MKSILNRAHEIEGEIISNRRYLHKNPEIGDKLQNTCKFVKEKLLQMGLEPIDIGTCGIYTLIGKKEGKTILLRADMDALPMREDNELEFKSTTKYAHMCGHDIHTSMLLGACKILKEREDELEGKVKVLFQPDEEGGHGAKDMIANGILENPKVDKAIALHVDAKAPLGKLLYGKGCTFCSSDSFEIIVKGKGGHGARPHECIDVINIASHINLNLQALISRECMPTKTVILTVCSINGGDTFNIFPEEATIKGSLRTYDEDLREKMLSRLIEISESTAAMFGGEIDIHFINSIPSIYCDEKFTEELLKYSREILNEEDIENTPVVKMGSEDFAYISEKIKSGFLFLGVGKNKNEGYQYGQHSSKALFNESSFYIGSAIHAYTAMEWLKRGN